MLTQSDHQDLNTQHAKVKALLLKGKYTLQELAEAGCGTEAGISARIREIDHEMRKNGEGHKCAEKVAGHKRLWRYWIERALVEQASLLDVQAEKHWRW